MAANHSFDIVSKVNFHELENAVNQAQKEISQRYDLKGTGSKIEVNQKELKAILTAKDEYVLKAVKDILMSKLIKRGVSVKVFDYEKIEPAFNQTVRQTAKIREGIDKESSKKIISKIKQLKLKVQSTNQGDSIRVSGKSIDDLQHIKQHLEASDILVPLQFVNYR